MKKKVLVISILILSISSNLIGCTKQSNEPSTEANTTETITTEDVSTNNNGLDNSNDIINLLFQGYSEVSKDKIQSCFYPNSNNIENNVNTILNNAKNIKDSTIYYLDNLIIYSIDMEANSLNSLGYTNVEAVKSNKVILPVDQTKNGETYKINNKYDIYTIQLNGKWYVANMIETDSVIVEQLTNNNPNTVEATLYNPAYKKEWVNTYILNEVSGNYEPVYVRITSILTGNKASDFINKYNEEKHEITFDKLDNNLEYIVYKYNIYFPSNFTETEQGITNPKISFNITNNNDENKINNTDGLSETIDISNPVAENTLHPGSTWENGIGVFKMTKDFKDYLIKINAPTIEESDNINENEYKNSYFINKKKDKEKSTEKEGE